MFKIKPTILPLIARVIIPKMMFVNGIIAKIKLIIQSKPKYALFDAILISPFISREVKHSKYAIAY